MNPRNLERFGLKVHWKRPPNRCPMCYQSDMLIYSVEDDIYCTRCKFWVR